MKVRPLRPAETFYRLLTPRWAHAPASGAGAAQFGGRFNREGVAALYLSRHVVTAATEYQQDELLMPPGTLVAYRIALTAVADLSGGFAQGDWDALWEDWHCDWRRLALAEHIEPPSWLLGDMVREQGVMGILFPSIKHNGGVNLVVYPDLLQAADELAPFDPNNDLPRDQSSWR